MSLVGLREVVPAVSRNATTAPRQTTLVVVPSFPRDGKNCLLVSWWANENADTKLEVSADFTIPMKLLLVQIASIWKQRVVLNGCSPLI
jgi:hypothetical protein